MEFDKCGNCGEVVERWTLEEFWIEEAGTHLDLCNECRKNYKKGKMVIIDG